MYVPLWLVGLAAFGCYWLWRWVNHRLDALEREMRAHPLARK